MNTLSRLLVHLLILGVAAGCVISPLPERNDSGRGGSAETGEGVSAPGADGGAGSDAFGAGGIGGGSGSSRTDVSASDAVVLVDAAMGSGGGMVGLAGTSGTGAGGSAGSAGGVFTANGGMGSTETTTTRTSSGVVTGGSTAPASSDVVTFYNGQASGVMTGFGWVALGAKDVIDQPTCEGRKITSSSPCTTFTNWTPKNALCVSGSIPALPASAVQSDYDYNWGIQIGVNAREPSDQIGTAASKNKTITFNFTGTPQAGLRAGLHRKGDPDGTFYCVDSIRSGVAISLTKFNTRCWGDVSTIFLTADDLPKIEKVGLQVSSTSIAITVSNLCLESLVWGW